MDRRVFLTSFVKKCIIKMRYQVTGVLSCQYIKVKRKRHG